MGANLLLDLKGKPRESRAKVIAALGILALLLLMLLVAGSINKYLYDEVFYAKGAQVLVRGASAREFLLAPLETPAGPLYAVLHWLFSGITGLQPAAMRWINVGLLTAGMIANSWSMNLLRLDYPWARAAMVSGIPIFWVTTGLALTEIPAFAFASFSVAAAIWSIVATEGRGALRWLGFAVSGVALGLAVLGRQPYIPAAAGFAAVAAFAPTFRGAAILAGVLSIAIPFPVFLLWGGLVPPHVAFVGGGIALGHGFLALAYLAVIILILAPGYYYQSWKWCLLAASIAGGIAVGAGGLDFQVAAGAADRLPTAVARIFQLAASGALIGGASALLVASSANILERRRDGGFILFTLLMLGLTMTAAGVVHQFSSRYLMTAFPFALFAVQPYFQVSLWAIVRVVAGGSLGYLTLLAYLQLPPAGA